MTPFEKTAIHRISDMELEADANRGGRHSVRSPEAVFAAADAGKLTIARREVLGGTLATGAPWMGVLAWPNEQREKEGGVHSRRRACGRLIALVNGRAFGERFFGPGKPSALFEAMTSAARKAGWNILRARRPDDEVPQNPYGDYVGGVPRDVPDDEDETVVGDNPGRRPGAQDRHAAEGREEETMKRIDLGVFENNLRTALAGHLTKACPIKGDALARTLGISRATLTSRLTQLRTRIPGLRSGRHGFWIDPSSTDKRQSDGNPAPPGSSASAVIPKGFLDHLAADQAPGCRGRRPDEKPAQQTPQGPTAGAYRVTVAGLPAAFDQEVSREMAEAVVRLAYGLSSPALAGQERSA